MAESHPNTLQRKFEHGCVPSALQSLKIFRRAYTISQYMKDKNPKAINMTIIVK